MPMPNFHTCRVKQPGLFIEGSDRTTPLSNGIQLISGHLKSGGTSMVAQSYHFPASKFTSEEARKWASSHNLHCLEFTVATGGAEKEPKSLFV